MTVIQRSRLRIHDGVSGPRSGLFEDFIEMEKGLGTLRRVCEGASPRSLAEPRDDSYTKVTPRRICDRVSGPRSGLYEDFIEREKGIGNLEEVCEGASPRSLAEPRDDSYTKVTPRRICDRVNGPARPPGFRLGGRNDGIAKVSLGGEGTGPRPLSTLRSSRGGLSAQRILPRRMFHLRRSTSGLMA